MFKALKSSKGVFPVFTLALLGMTDRLRLNCIDARPLYT